MAIKVIIMDIDGTLVNDEKVITPLTKETLLKAQDKGVRLVLASGRPTSGLLKLAEELDMENHHGLFVLSKTSLTYIYSSLSNIGLALKFFRCSKIALLSSTEIAWL